MNAMTALPQQPGLSMKSQQAVARDDQSTAPLALLDSLARLFKLLSDATRLQILHYLSDGQELHVRALCDLLGESQPAVSHHLALLREAGLLERRRDGKHNFYGLRTRCFVELLDQVFADAPPEQRRTRFEQYVARHWPA
jgi:ArsR family transcriptional regulator